MNTRICKMCQKILVGRSDKIFCGVKCKSSYNIKLRQVTNKATFQIDNILHRNRSILLEICGKHKVQIKIKRDALNAKKFNYIYHTHIHINKQGKTIYYVYDFSWMIFSDQEVLIKRLNKQ